MKRLIWMLAALVLLFGGVGQTRAEFIITFSQVGANVEANGSGTLNLAALTFSSFGSATTQLMPSEGIIQLGQPGNENINIYTGASGPSNFGTGFFAFPSAGTGLGAGIYGYEGYILTPSGYASGGTISSSSTYDNTTISTLGLTPGTYTWTWGTGTNADSFEVIIPSASPPTAIPEPSTLTLFGLGAVCSLGYGWRRRRQCA